MARAKAKQQGVRSRRDLKRIGKQIRHRHTAATPARRDALSVDGTRRLSDVAREAADERQQHGWTKDRDEVLRAHFRANPRTAISRVAQSFGVKRGEVKRRARELGLLEQSAKPPAEQNARGFTRAEWKGAGYDPAQFDTAVNVTEGTPASQAIADLVVALRGTDRDHAEALLARIKGHTLAPRFKGEGPSAHQLAHQLEYAKESTWFAAAEAIATEDLAQALAPKKQPKTLAVACPQGDLRLVIARVGRKGFKVVEGGDYSQTYGTSPHGLPICPNHNVELLAAEPIAASEAVSQVVDAAPQPQKLFETERPFNFEDVWMAIENMDDDIESREDELDTALVKVKKQRKELDALKAKRKAAVKEFKQRRLAHERAAVARREKREEAEADAIRADAICEFEKAAGRPCRVCRGVSRALALANLGEQARTAFADVWSEAHRSAAVKANSIDPARLTRIDPAIVAAALDLAGLLGIPAAVVETWSETDRLAAVVWMESDRQGEAPAVIGIPHVAAAAGSDAQACAVCGARLSSPADDGEGDRALTTYPEGALVGSHCTGTIPAAAATEEAAATA